MHPLQMLDGNSKDSFQKISAKLRNYYSLSEAGLQMMAHEDQI